MNLNDNYGGRCCGRKPITYKRDGIKFCPRCDREFDLTTGEQKENVAWKKDRGVFVRVESGGGGE